MSRLLITNYPNSFDTAVHLQNTSHLSLYTGGPYISLVLHKSVPGQDSKLRTPPASILLPGPLCYGYIQFVSPVPRWTAGLVRMWGGGTVTQVNELPLRSICCVCVQVCMYMYMYSTFMYPFRYLYTSMYDPPGYMCNL